MCASVHPEFVTLVLDLPCSFTFSSFIHQTQDFTFAKHIYFSSPALMKKSESPARLGLSSSLNPKHTKEQTQNKRQRISKWPSEATSLVNSFISPHLFHSLEGTVQHNGPLTVLGRSCGAIWGEDSCLNTQTYPALFFNLQQLHWLGLWAWGKGRGGQALKIDFIPGNTSCTTICSFQKDAD